MPSYSVCITSSANFLSSRAMAAISTSGISELGTPLERFSELARRFSFDVKIAEKMVEMGLKDLQDFRYIATSDAEIASNLVATTGIEETTKITQAARVRRAWHEVRAALELFEQSKKKSEVGEDSAPLEKPIQEGLEAAFFSRYKLRLEPDEAPSDSLVARLYREVERRALNVHSLSAVRSMSAQLTDAPKRRKVGDGLYVDTAEEEEQEVADTSTYLERLRILLMGFAKIGTKRIDGTASKPAEGIATPTTDYVTIPLDILLKYHSRCVRITKEAPPMERLSTLRRLDEAERTEWVSEFRGTERTLGDIIVTTMRRRDAHWTVAPRGQQAAQTSNQAGHQAKPAAASGSGTSKAQIKLATTLRDGTKLCASFNTKQGCQGGTTCKSGAHRCAVILRSGRTCGASHHGAQACDNKRR